METRSFVVGESGESCDAVSFADTQSITVSDRNPGDEANAGDKANSGDESDAGGETFSRVKAPDRDEAARCEGDEHATAADPTDQPT